MQRKKQVALILFSILLALFAAGCKKEPAPAPPPPPPPPAPEPAPAASVSITAEPSSIERGKSATLKWSSTNAVSASINQGIGAVAVSGSREVFPTRTTEYAIAVKNEDGKEATASATVTVRAPPPPPPPPPPKPDLSEAFRGMVNGGEIKDAFFDYDKSDIRSDAEAALRADATALKKLINEYSAAAFLIEGHCDERGTTEYNLALGDRRTKAARDFLVNLGVPASKLSSISLGEERPQCTEQKEECYQRNRRAHLTLK